MDLGIRSIFRETLLSSLAMSEQALKELGREEQDARHIVDVFRERDAKLIREQHAVQHDEAKLIQSSKDTARELESLLTSDRRTRSR